MYLELYNIISQFLFNGDPSTAVYGEFICEAVPSVLCVLLLMLPFVVVWRVMTKLLS